MYFAFVTVLFILFVCSLVCSFCLFVQALLNFYCIFWIQVYVLFLRFWIIFPIITLNSFSDRLFTSFLVICFYNFFFCSFACNIFFCHLILSKLLCFWSSFCRLQGCSSCFWYLPPRGRGWSRSECPYHLDRGLDSWCGDLSLP